MEFALGWTFALVLGFPFTIAVAVWTVYLSHSWTAGASDERGGGDCPRKRLPCGCDLARRVSWLVRVVDVRFRLRRGGDVAEG